LLQELQEQLKETFRAFPKISLMSERFLKVQKEEKKFSPASKEKKIGGQ
jgi:hypothetical protein